MQINIIGRHLQITDDIRSYIEKRASKIQGIFSSILDLHIVIEHDKESVLYGNNTCDATGDVSCTERNLRPFYITRYGDG